MRTFITIDENFVVKDVVCANIAAGFLLAPRDNIQVGDVLSDDEKIQMMLMPAPEGYAPPQTLPPEPPAPTDPVQPE